MLLLSPGKGLFWKCSLVGSSSACRKIQEASKTWELAVEQHHFWCSKLTNSLFTTSWCGHLLGFYFLALECNAVRQLTLKSWMPAFLRSTWTEQTKCCQIAQHQQQAPKRKKGAGRRKRHGLTARFETWPPLIHKISQNFGMCWAQWSGSVAACDKEDEANSQYLAAHNTTLWGEWQLENFKKLGWTCANTETLCWRNMAC